MFAYVQHAESLKRLTIVSVEGGKQILSLLFPNLAAFIVDNGRVAFCQNLTLEVAEVLNPEPRPVEEPRPVAPAPVPVKPKKKPVTAKKATVKSKVKGKGKPKKPKKTVLKKKVVAKPKKPNKSKAQANKKKGKR